MPTIHYPPHVCEREGCTNMTRNKRFCSHKCSLITSKEQGEAGRKAKLHPCMICGEPTKRKICGKKSCRAEFFRRSALHRGPQGTRRCIACGQEKSLNEFRRLSDARNCYFSSTCHACRPENAYVLGQTEVPRVQPKPKPVPVQAAWKDPDPGRPVLPIAVDEHGRRSAIPWSSLNLGGLPGTSTSATPFAA